MKLSKITKQLEALQTLMDKQGNSHLPTHDPSGSANSNSAQQDGHDDLDDHDGDDEKESETEAQRVQRFGKSE